MGGCTVHEQMSPQNLTYDQYRDIRFKPKEAVWGHTKLPFELQFFHEGWRFRFPVKINEITAQGVHEIRFDPDAFDYGKNKIDPNQLRGLGFAGFRVHYLINTPSYKDEVLEFLGASYFRALGRGQVYGLSARGLAIDTARSSGEEFPRFVEFWIVRPASSANELTIYALLDSPSLSGAYRFILEPGVTTALDIRVRLQAIGDPRVPAEWNPCAFRDMELCPSPRLDLVPEHVFCSRCDDGQRRRGTR